MEEGTPRFVDELPRLAPGERFPFRCSPETPCFNACCTDLDLLLTPYDVLRLRQATGMSGAELLQAHVEIGEEAETGFPELRLRMRDDPDRSCPFVRPSGCSIYAHRPGACRAYPLGRGASCTACGAITEQFALVREDHCLGFGQGREWTARDWIRDQGMDPYVAFNDLYLKLVFLYRSAGVRLDLEGLELALLALYRLDELPEALERRGLMDARALPGPLREAMAADEAERLRFALGWLARRR